MTSDTLARRLPWLLPPALELRTRWPGALLCAVIAMAATFIARSQGGPQLLYALFFGIAFHFLLEDPKIRPGVHFCTRNVLHLGVGLLGARITATQIAALGWSTALIVIGAVASTIAFGIWLARRLGLSATLGMLSGGATAICGASAALAISAVLPKSDEQERQTLLVVVCVTSLSTLAMLFYPMVAQFLALPAPLAGLFLGGTIHDVAQVVGAAYTLGPAVGDVAILVKLFRIVMLTVVVLAVSAACRPVRACDEHGAQARKPTLLPWFMKLFLLLVLLHTLKFIPDALQAPLDNASRACLVAAIAGLGIKTSFKALFETGWRPFVLLLCETLWLAVGVLGASLVLKAA